MYSSSQNRKRIASLESLFNEKVFSKEKKLIEKFSNIELQSRVSKSQQSFISKSVTKEAPIAQKKTNKTIYSENGYIIINEKSFFKISDINGFQFTEHSTGPYLEVIINGAPLKAYINKDTFREFKKLAFINDEDF